MTPLFKALYTLIFISFFATSAVADSNAQRHVIDYNAQFELTGSDGKTTTFDSLEGRVSLIYFGYTSCLMQCPPTWISFEQIHSLLGADTDRVQLIFISIDPQRDSVEQLAAWQKNWPHILGLTGSAGQVDDAAAAFNIFYAMRPEHAMPSAMPFMMQVRKNYGADNRINWNAKNSDDYYMMDHTTHAFLIDEENKYLTHFELEESPDTITSYIKEYLNR